MENVSNLFENCTIRGLPITVPFKIHYDVEGKDSEIGTFIILPFQVTVMKPNLFDFTKTFDHKVDLDNSYSDNIHDSSNGDPSYIEDPEEEGSKIIIKVEPQDHDIADNNFASHFDERASQVDYRQIFDAQTFGKKKRIVKNTPRVRYKRKKSKNFEDNEEHTKTKIKRNKLHETDFELEEIQKPKLVKLEESDHDDNIEGSHRKSKRLQYAGFRPDYQNVENKVDNVLKYLEGDNTNSDDEVKEVQEDSDYESVTTSGNNSIADNRAKTEKNKLSGKRKKTKDPDFDPTDVYSDKVIIKKESALIENEISDIDYESDLDYLDENDSKFSDEKKTDKKEKLSKSETQTKRIYVKLEEHPDKYKIETLDPLKREDRAKSELERYVTVYVCTMCNKFNSESVEGIEGHLENHLNGELTCTECDFFSTNVAEVVMHKAQMHTRHRKACPECGVTLGYGRLKPHYGLVHDNPQYVCVYCQKNEGIVVKFATCSHLRKHLKAAHREVCLTCKICDKVFIKGDHLRYHLTKCTGKKDTSRQCEKCGNKFASEPNLLRHMERVHLKVRRYMCPECPFAAKSPSVLRNHKYVHQGRFIVVLY
jgi:hypothetical protein